MSAAPTGAQAGGKAVRIVLADDSDSTPMPRPRNHDPLVHRILQALPSASPLIRPAYGAVLRALARESRS